MFASTLSAAVALPSTSASARPSVCTARPAACPRPSLVPAFAFARAAASVSCSALAEEAPQTSSSSDVATPVIKIDNHSDPFATVVNVSYGDKEMGDLGVTAQALKQLDLNIKKASYKTEAGGTVKCYYVTDAFTSEKITKSERLEHIRLTIMDCLTQYHPEVVSQLSRNRAPSPLMYESDEEWAPLGVKTEPVDTRIKLKEHPAGLYTEVDIRTEDRPGLLVEIVQLLKTMSVNVVSAEIDTEGRVAKDSFFVTYHGEALNASMQQLIVNTLQYHLSIKDVFANEESY